MRGAWDRRATLPLIVLTLSQFEFLVVTPNPAIGPTTILFVLLFAACLLVRGTRLRLALLVIVSFVMEQTGYTILFAAIAIALFGLLLVRAVRERTGVVPHALALAASIASVVFFAWGLVPIVGGECSRLGTEPARYLRFAEQPRSRQGPSAVARGTRDGARHTNGCRFGLALKWAPGHGRFGWR